MLACEGWAESLAILALAALVAFQTWVDGRKK
jgi:hypothetical protein